MFGLFSLFPKFLNWYLCLLVAILATLLLHKIVQNMYFGGNRLTIGSYSIGQDNYSDLSIWMNSSRISAFEDFDKCTNFKSEATALLKVENPEMTIGKDQAGTTYFGIRPATFLLRCFSRDDGKSDLIFAVGTPKRYQSAVIFNHIHETLKSEAE